MKRIKVEGHENLYRDVYSNAIINDNKSEFSLYMKRHKIREKQNDDVRNACKEINNLKKEFYEIKKMLLELGKKNGN